MINDNNKKWLVMIAVILVGIFSVMIYGVTQNTDTDTIGDSISDVLDSADEGAKEFKEELKDEIDDNTDSR